MATKPFRRSWTIELVDRPELAEIVAALLCTTSDGFATRATSEVSSGSPASDAVRVAGVWGAEPPGHLVAGPSWIPSFSVGQGVRWRLDMERAVVEHELLLPGAETVRTVRFGSGARSRTGVLLVDPCPDRWLRELDAPGPIVLRGLDRQATVEVAQRVEGRTLLRVAVAVEGGLGDDACSVAARRAAEALAAGPDGLLAEHEAVWRSRWAGAAVDLAGDPYHELAIRFALFHLLSLSTGEAQLAVGARGLTGPAYGGHVFWDADVYVLPALAAIDPPSAEAMLRYRVARLPAARDRAGREGRPGARFPWESAGTGREATPTEAVGIDGSRIPIVTGEREIHISSDVAWGAVHLARWTGDEAVREAGRELIVETARYLAHRIEVDGDGSAHLRQVMGPDEYHEDVDDNAFTNVMARWHLRCAAELCGDGEVAGRWRRLADRLVDGLDPSDGRYRQFAGFDALDPVLLTAVATPPVAADVLLGREMVARAQIIKQADVIMLHHLVPDELHPGSLQPDLAYYLPRTAHGSSLSPAIHAAVLARAGLLDEADHWLDVALRLDLHDLTGTAAGGVHLATMGGCWQAVAMGYLGLRVDPSGALCFDPAFPQSIAGLTVRCKVRGRAVTARADHQSAVIESDGLLRFSPAGSGAGRALEADRLELHGGTGRWEVIGR